MKSMARRRRGGDGAGDQCSGDITRAGGESPGMRSKTCPGTQLIQSHQMIPQ